jgi:uncharacterized cupin superfamily protein
MPKIDISKIPVRSGSFYPAPFKPSHEGRHKQALGDAGGLTQFGVNLTRIAPGSASALRHWHEAEDEFIYILDGELVLVENEGETVLKPGDAAAFKAGNGNAHRLLNRSGRDAVYLEVGARASIDRVHYPDDDLLLERDPQSRRYLHKSGEPYT